jgi:Ca2+-binding EF-hand superfamily protein
MKQIQTENLNEKIDLFFKIIDTDGNGMLSYDEVGEICEMSLTNCFTPSEENEEFI